MRAGGLGLALLLLASACGGAPFGAPVTSDPFAGQYSVNGGGAALDSMRALYEAFRKQHPGLVFQMEDIGSDAGVNLTMSGDTDLGFISRDLKPAEQGKVTTVPIGVLGTAVAVNAANPVQGLTKDQVRMIFAGEITDWSNVGGAPGKIRVLIREKDSATRGAFESYFFGGKATYVKDAIEVYEIDETLKAIYSFKDAIGMVTLGNRALTDTRIHLLALDGVAATKESIAAGSYKIRRPLYIVHRPDASTLKPAIRAFLDFVKGPEGQNILAGL